MSLLGCDLNWSAQHFSLFERTGVKPDETAPPHILFSRATGRDLGAMASRGVDARHRPAVRSGPFIDLLGFGAERGHSTADATTITAGIDACRARGDFAWPSRGAIASLYRSIAHALGRSASTLSREIGRNGGSQRYRAAAADSRAWTQAMRPKLCKLATHNYLRQAVAAKLA